MIEIYETTLQLHIIGNNKFNICTNSLSRPSNQEGSNKYLDTHIIYRIIVETTKNVQTLSPIPINA